MEFDAASYHGYIEREMRNYLDAVSLLAASAVEEMLPGAVVGRFADWLLCTSPATAVDVRIVENKLEAAFTGATFNVTIEERV
jgi:hypothetical protein